jgi:phosphate transport system substrate-binding protein
VKLQRTGLLVGLVAAALALTACGSDNNSGGSASSSTSNAGSGSGIQCQSGTLTGAGSSAQKNAMDEWIKKYQQACSGSTINYQSVGSGAGVQQFLEGTIDFGGSDSALKDTEQPKADARCKTGKGINLPMVTGPLGVAYNLQGVDNLVLDAPTTASIFSGKIAKWTDPAIAKLNSGVTLPDTPIQPFHRSDSSGTTDNFTKYLTAAAGSSWAFGSGKEWKAPGGQGAKGNEGVSAGVKGADGAVGYLELSFIENSGLKAAKIATGASQPVELTADNASKAVDAAKLVGSGNDLKLKIDYGTKADGVYPIVLVTYEIVCEKGTPGDKLPLLKSFLGYTASAAGQEAISSIGYAPLPSSFIEKVRKAVDSLS